MLGLWEFFYTSWAGVPQTLLATVSLSASDAHATGVSKTLSLTAQGSISVYQTAFAVATSATPVILPIGAATSGITFVAIHNIGNFPVTVTWTPFQGASNVVKTIQPGGFLVEGDSSVGSGITALSFQAIGSPGSVEFYLLG